MAIATADELRASSKRWRHRAALDHFGGEHADSLACAGISLEHLCKAYLVQINSALIAEPGGSNFESLLHHLGFSHLAKLSPRTIGALQAWERVQRLCTLNADNEAARLLIDIRNGVLHSASIGGGRVQRVFIEFADITDQLELLLDPNQKPADIWPYYLDMIDSLRREDEQARREDLDSRVRVAGRRAMEVLRGITPADLLALKELRRSQNLALLSQPNASWEEWAFHSEINHAHVEQVRCPVLACGDEGALMLGAVVPPKEPEDGNLFIAAQFRCGVCELHLPTMFHIGAAGLRMHWKVQSL